MGQLVPSRASARIRRAAFSFYMLNRDQKNRLVRAFSGEAVPGEEGTQASASSLTRRPSWETKFEAPEVPAGLDKALDEGAQQRLKRRPSCVFSVSHFPHQLPASRPGVCAMPCMDDETRSPTCVP